MTELHPLPADLEPTRATLHAYANAVGVIPRAHAVPHPRWWHISLNVAPTGLTTDAMRLPGGGTFRLRMDLHQHVIVLETSLGEATSFDMTAGTSAHKMGEQLIAAVADLGLGGDYDTAKFSDDDDRMYDPTIAAAFFGVILDVNQILATRRALLAGEVGPLQLWPHGFDLAFEWFGTRVEIQEENGQATEYPSQINLGFYPAGRAYFYSNPWPFEADRLLDRPLPYGEWHTDEFEGTKLYYDEVVGSQDGDQKVAAFAEAVYEAAAPTLMA